MAKNIFRTLFRPPPRRVNELFLPHRMAYIIDLESAEGQQDDEGERGFNPLDDIPTTLIRSKADCPNAEVRARKFLLPQATCSSLLDNDDDEQQ